MSINHHREGAGQPLVLIHGIGLRWQIWRPVIGPLAASFEVIACDSPGFGQSPPLTDGVSPTVPAYAEAFERFFDAEGLARPHVAGNSMGGRSRSSWPAAERSARRQRSRPQASGLRPSAAFARPRWHRSRKRRAPCARRWKL